MVVRRTVNEYKDIELLALAWLHLGCERNLTAKRFHKKK